MNTRLSQPSALSRLRGSNGIIAVSVFLNFSGLTLIIPVLPFIVARFVPGSEIAFWVSSIIATFALCSFIAAPILGRLGDRFGRRPILVFSLLGSALGFLIFGIGGALWVLFLGRVIEGLTAGSISTMYAYIADTNAPKDRGPVYGLLGAAGGFGFMLGPVLGGLLGQVSLSAPLYAAAVLAVANALWVYKSVPESRAMERPAERLGWQELNALTPLVAALRDRRLRLLFAVAFMFYGAATLMQSNLAVLLKDVLALNTTSVGLALFGVGLMDIVSQGVATPWLLPRLGERLTAVAGLMVNAAGFALFAALAKYPSIPLLMASIAVFTFGDGLFQPASNAMISDSAPAGQQGQVQGANQAQQSIARVVGPLASAFLYGLVPSGPYIAGCLICIAAATLLWAALSTWQATVSGVDQEIPAHAGPSETGGGQQRE